MECVRVAGRTVGEPVRICDRHTDTVGIFHANVHVARWSDFSNDARMPDDHCTRTGGGVLAAVTSRGGRAVPGELVQPDVGSAAVHSDDDWQLPGMAHADGIERPDVSGNAAEQSGVVPVHVCIHSDGDG